jgi:hypothetical protein
MSRMRLKLAVLLVALVTATVVPAQAAEQPEPGSPAYVARDLRNIADAYGRVTGPGGQLANPSYFPALVQQSSLLTASQLLAQAANPTRLALTAGNVVPGWNVGNPLRAGWNGTRGRSQRVAFTNRDGALLRGTVYAPMAGARDPYTGAPLTGPFPGVVITPGSIQGSEGMYVWLAQDLAERGYVVLTYDVQGQGTSETLPHTTDSVFPFCNPFVTPVDGNMNGCPGVPFQQIANFVVGTEDATSFLLSTPQQPYPNPGSAGAQVDAANPYAAALDHSPDLETATPGRTTRVALIGHSLGAAAVSKVQGTDTRVQTIVALDKLTGPSDSAFGDISDNANNVPTVPALAVQSEYGFTVSPYFLSGGSTLLPAAGNPDPMRERRVGFDDWKAAGVDTMLVVPRASTHLEYADIPYVLPASRWGQALTSGYVQAWLDHYLKHRANDAELVSPSARYLEPRGRGVWAPVTLDRPSLLSFSYCSAYAFGSGASAHVDGDVSGVGGCTE